MAKKERLGSDPLSFIKDTREEVPQDKESSKKKDIDVNPAAETKSADNADLNKTAVKKEDPPSKEKPEKKKAEEKKTSPGSGEKEETIKAENLSMKIKTEGKEQTSILFSGEMSIYNVKKIKESLVKSMETCKTVELDLSGVSKIDTAAYQMILAAKIEAEKKDKTVIIKNPSGEVKKLFDLYGESLNQ